MGAAYNVISAACVNEHPFAIESLSTHGMAVPRFGSPARNPTPRELRAVLDELPGYAVDYQVTAANWQAIVEGVAGAPLLRAETLVCVVDFGGDETQPHIFYFDGGDSKLNILIVERLSAFCGPLFVFPDTGARPLLVIPGTDPLDAVKVWEIA